MTHSDTHIDCTWTRGRIDRFLDGDLSGEDVLRLQSHVESCRRCREELALAAGVLHELRGLPEEACPPAIVEEVLDVIDGRDAAPALGRLERWLSKWRGLVLRPALTAAVLIAVVAGSIAIDRWHRARNRVSPAELAEAEAQLKWTFAYVNSVSRRASFAVRDDVIGKLVVGPIRKSLYEAADDERPASKQETNGGS